MRKKVVGLDLKVNVEPWGPDRAVLDAAARTLLKHTSVRKYLGDAQHQLLSVELIEPVVNRKTARVPAPSKRYRATLYDYTNNRAILIDGNLDDRDDIAISESSQQPIPGPEEFAAAVKMLQKDRELGSLIAKQRLKPYPPMPPTIDTELPDGRIERTIAVGLLPAEAEKGLRHEIVGVNMIRQSVVRFEGGYPSGVSLADSSTCGVPNAGQPTTSKGTAGQVNVTVTQAGKVLWTFIAVRPSASSGTNGSGIELRYVNYRGKRVLYRAHVPILNVKYDPGGCGCYRDWQYAEGMIQATGTDIGSTGFRVCPSPAKTVLDTGADAGNFRGVAVYVQGQEVVLVSEMQAGWYRYISEWRLHANGTIRPRFGFSAVTSSCVCHVHHHHVYWRFDFDIRTPGNNLVREFNDPPLFPPAHWHNKLFEIRRPRDPARKRKWRVENTVTGEAYEVIPGSQDGVATAMPDWPFPHGDVWILRYHGTEIDDGMVATFPCEVDLDRFVNGEAIYNQDVVIWYGAHFTHDVTHEPPGTFGEIIGPDLKPVEW